MVVLDFIHRSLTTRVAPMVYIMMGVSVFIGFCFGTGIFMASVESILYTSGVLLPRQTWGTILLLTALLAEVGFLTKNLSLIKVGGLAGFAMWLLASIELALDGHWYVFVTVGMLHLLFHGYVYLAASMGVLERSVDTHP